MKLLALKFIVNKFLIVLFLVLCQTGCVVLAVADVVGTVAVKTAGLAADVAVGTVKVTGKVIGAALPGGDDKPELKK